MIGSGGVHDMGGVLLPSISILEGSLLLARDSQTTLSQWDQFINKNFTADNMIIEFRFIYLL
jgi:hypothetical protein